MPAASAWIDISVPLRSGMVNWPDDSPVRIRRMLDMDKGDSYNSTHLDMGAHTGTHMDAPRHFLQDGPGLDEMPLSATLGPARVIEIVNPVSIEPEELRRHELQRGERVLFKTRNSLVDWAATSFNKDFVHISPDAAEHLVACGVRTVGIDYLSVGGYEKGGVETHQILMKAGIWIIEGLNLSVVESGRYELVCLPIKITESDGAPCRAVLKPL